MWIDALLLVCGIAVLLGGGEAIVRGATRLANDLGVTPMAIGLTLVAFGTSAPELGVNVTAAWRGRGDICFGNIMGSNMANIGLVIGVSALVRTLRIQRPVVVREMPMMLLATAATMAMAFDRLLGGSVEELSRSDGLVLLVLFALFLYYAVGDMARQRELRELEGVLPGQSDGSPLLHVAVTAVGLVALVGGGQITVDAAVGLARALHVSEVIIGLTVLAVGTSLPELVASVVAMVRGHTELAVGNVVGSNIFNLLLVAGVSASVHPIPVPGGGRLDLVFVMLLSLALLLVSVTTERRVRRREAVVMVLGYVAYVSWRSTGGGA